MARSRKPVNPQAENALDQMNQEPQNWVLQNGFAHRDGIR